MNKTKASKKPKLVAIDSGKKQSAKRTLIDCVHEKFVGVVVIGITDDDGIKVHTSSGIKRHEAIGAMFNMMQELSGRFD